MSYAPGMHGEFVLDDQHTVESSSGIRHLDHYLDPAVWLGILRANRVVTELTFALDYAVGKLDPFLYHATNVAIHLGAVLLVYAFVRRLLDDGGLAGERYLAWVVAAVFALHPLQTQAVIYVSQRAESLASALYLGALLLVLAAERRGLTWAGAALYLAALVVFILGMGAKSIVLTMPLAYLLIGLLPGRASYAEKLARPAKRILLATPFVLCSLLAMLRTVPTFQGRAPALNTAGFAIPSLPPWRYFLTEWHVVVTYLRLLFWPTGQHLDWDFPPARGPTDPTAWLCGLLLAALLLGAGYAFLRFRARDDRVGSVARVASFGVFWFFLVLSLTSSIVPLLDVLFEHRLYLASLGIYLAAIVLVDHALCRLSKSRRQRLATVLVVLLCGSLATLTYLRASVWKSKLLLWSEVVEKSPRKARGHLNLAETLRKLGQPQRAVEECQVALSLAKNDSQWIRTNARGEMAAALFAQSRRDEAIAVLKAGLQEDPDDAGLWGALAVMYFQQDDLTQAECAAERYVRAGDHLAAAYRVQGFVRMRRGNYAGGTEAFEQALRLEPDELQNALLVAAAYRTQGRGQEACDLLHSAKGPNPDQNPMLDEALRDCGRP